MSIADLPIRRKILMLALITSGCVLLLACGVLVAYELLTLKRELTRESTTLAEVIATNSTAALAFDSREEARDLLAALSADPSIVAASLYDDRGELFASFTTAGDPPLTLSRPEARGQFFMGKRSVFYQPVMQDGQRMGTLVLESDLRRWYGRLWLYLLVVLAVMGVALVVTVVLSTLLRKSITRPIDELAETARAVSERGVYSVRARRHSNDELGVLTDVFNHMLAQIEHREERLRESEERLRMALLAADMGTWRYDLATQLTTRDERMNRLLGRGARVSQDPLHDFVGLVDEEDRPAVKQALDRALSERGEYSVECRIILPDGSRRWVRDRGRVLPSVDGKSFYMAGAIFDISDRKASEEEIRLLNVDLEKRVALRTAELAEINEDLEAFTFSVSHDLRTPLRTVAGFAELLLEDHRQILPRKGLDQAARIIRGAEKMGSLIENLLRFSRLGRQSLTLQLSELDKLVDEVVADLEAEIGNRKVEWRRLSLGQLRCDPALLRQVFANLISNAVKYSRTRDISVIEIGRRGAKEDGAFYVKDNGVGFDSRYREKLFAVFQRLHSSEQFEGSGVGLATVARIIRRHGGRVWAEGEVEQGATFFFWLPSDIQSGPGTRNPFAPSNASAQIRLVGTNK